MGQADYYPTLKGAEKQRWLNRFKAQIRKWGLTMPHVKPVAIPFGRHKFAKVGLIEYWIVNNEKEGYCGKFLFVFDGQTCPYHHHAFKHETFFVMKGTVSMKVAGRRRVLKEGSTLVMPQGTDHSFTGLGPALLLEVSKPCQQHDNIFEDKSIGKNGIY
jgi:N-acetylneuraminate synthase